GWHYVLDDVGGVVLGALALLLARALTGIDLRATREGRGVAELDRRAVRYLRSGSVDRVVGVKLKVR
ncbi:MAG TPA: hypothetical protein VGV90_09465, partial [Solirubrobacteraceae bacterium]|nr:hypothetical protein [Solirubrobacteraceae bacterium]